MPDAPTTTRLNEVWAEGLRRTLEAAQDIYEFHTSRLLSEAQSPIEELFLIGLVVESDGNDLLIKPQHQIGPYRVDVLLEWWDSGFDQENQTPHGEVIVELDGHDFHERTKAQAAADKSRDRYLTGEQYRVIRFTGSEVYADPFGCARNAIHVAAMAFYEGQGMRRR